MDKDTWFEFEKSVDIGPSRGSSKPLVAGGFCGLCANSGFINIKGLRTPAGLPLDPVVNQHCICPNGRVIKFQDDKAAAHVHNGKN